MQRATYRVQHAVCNMQHAVCKMQHAVCNMQHRAIQQYRHSDGAHRQMYKQRIQARLRITVHLAYLAKRAHLRDVLKLRVEQGPLERK